MEINNLDKMFKGWVVGNFKPSLYNTNHVEVAVKKYNSGDYEPTHFHKIATEITVIGKGKVLMNGNEYKTGDIITIKPGEKTDFKVLEDTLTTVIKLPSVKDDKYII
jgi:quercetin dioxygenase-like cupin family protein